jgi:hypothetical protein
MLWRDGLVFPDPLWSGSSVGQASVPRVEDERAANALLKCGIPDVFRIRPSNPENGETNPDDFERDDDTSSTGFRPTKVKQPSRRIQPSLPTVSEIQDRNPQFVKLCTKPRPRCPTAERV